MCLVHQYFDLIYIILSFTIIFSLYIRFVYSITFSGNGETKKTEGFYDGNGEYVVRFMPEQEGTYTFTVKGSFSEETYSGEFFVTKPWGKGEKHLRFCSQDAIIVMTAPVRKIR